MKIIRATQKYIPACRNYIKKQTCTAKSDIIRSAHYYKYNFKNGWEAGGRVARLKGKKPLAALLTKVYGSLSKTKVRQEDIPAILGGVGLMTPIPAASIGGYVLGKLLNMFLKILKK